MRCRCIKDFNNPINNIVTYKVGNVYDYDIITHDGNMISYTYWRIYVGNGGESWYYADVVELNKHFIDTVEYRDRKIGELLGEV